MRAVLQRVARAAVSVDGETVGAIGRGAVILLGVGQGDGPDQAEALAAKVAHLRVFDDDAGKMNLSLVDIGGEVLSVSQFTLYADTSRGRRPGFSYAAPPQEAERLYALFNERLRALGIPVATGRFGARMLVEIYNDGPVTLILEASS
ncbi:MAG: D-tyrosyl-tRNA(Tyr) deacylase [Armatimonadetes bacterium]|nr:D-tyrosyl-tRNA(Tyr) deacylase [Armatimonadota bacterium]